MTNHCEKHNEHYLTSCSQCDRETMTEVFRQPKDIEEIVEEFWAYHTVENSEGKREYVWIPEEMRDWLHTTLTALTQHHQAEVRKAVGEIEDDEIYEDADRMYTWRLTTYRQFDTLEEAERAREQFITPTKTDKQTEV